MGDVEYQEEQDCPQDAALGRQPAADACRDDAEGTPEKGVADSRNGSHQGCLQSSNGFNVKLVAGLFIFLLHGNACACDEGHQLRRCVEKGQVAFQCLGCLLLLRVQAF